MVGGQKGKQRKGIVNGYSLMGKGRRTDKQFWVLGFELKEKDGGQRTEGKISDYSMDGW